VPAVRRRLVWANVRSKLREKRTSVTVRGGRIVELDILADPERLRRLDLSRLDA
jgi:hypothetical protein